MLWFGCVQSWSRASNSAIGGRRYNGYLIGMVSIRDDCGLSQSMCARTHTNTHTHTHTHTHTEHLRTYVACGLVAIWWLKNTGSPYAITVAHGHLGGPNSCGINCSV